MTLMAVVMTIMGLASLAAGWVVLSIGVQMLRERLRARARMIPVSGTIVRVESRTRSSSIGGRTHISKWYFPVVQFTTRDGVSKIFTSEVGEMNESRFVEGAPLNVRYDPEGQLAPLVDSWSGIWFAPVSMIFGGIVFVALPVIGLIVVLRNR